MPSEKKQVSLLKSKDYKINGNLLRAFYDKQGKLVFVLDSTVDDIKPNVLLVMASRGDRKWDDVLANDYAMDLELVRPKKDNKYQKLDIEYDGLVVYDNLIRAYQDGGDVKKFLRELREFREESAYRSATERLAAANVIAENARETIERTGDTIVELQAKIKAVKSKVTTLRRSIGKEPTKQSAAKILRAEAQLDVLNGKLERAKKRLENANKRLLTAEDDIAAAQAVLDLIPDADAKKFKTVETHKENAGKKIQEPEFEPVGDVVEQDTDDEDEEVVMRDDDIVPDDTDEDTEPDGDDEEPDTSGDDVKPLFDKDPNIMDEKIAFKPISFDEKVADVDDASQTDLSVAYDDKDQPVEEASDTKEENPDEVVAPAPENKPAMSFEPPKAVARAVDVPEAEGYNDADVELDDIFAELEDDEDEEETTPEKPTEAEPVNTENDTTDEQSTYVENVDTVPVLESDNRKNEIVAVEEEAKQEPEINVTPVVESKMDDTSIVAPVATPSTEKLVRPMSPNAASMPVANVPVAPGPQHKPNVLYYVLLLVLIGLSVFTLWLYQRSNVTGEDAPTLTNDAQEVALVQKDAESQVVKTQEEPEKTTVTADEEDSGDPFVASGAEVQANEAATINNVAEKSLNKIAEAAEVGDTQTEDEEEPGTASQEVEPVEEESAEPVVVNKPEYNVTQDDVFTTSESSVSGGSLCDGDVAPDTNGCCPGESYSVVDGQNVCCPDDGGDCFPPMF